ncbi:MAG: hypothetical protein R3E76_10570 [Planctomycetota bacterium]
MPEPVTETLQLKPVRSRKRLRRSLVATALIAIAALLLCTVGWPWINNLAVGYAESRLDSQLADSARQLPEIVDHEALMRQEVHGSNGWDQVMAGRSHWAAVLESRKSGDSSYEPVWINKLGQAGLESKEGWEWLLKSEEQSEYFGRRHFPQALRLTDWAAKSAAAAASCDSIVRVKKDWSGEYGYPFPSWSDYVGILILRVRMLQEADEFTQADSELVVLMRILSKHTERFSKQVATSALGLRNAVLGDCVVPMLEQGLVSVDARKEILALRWRTVGNDPKLWINNASFTYAWITEIKEEGFAQYWGHNDDDPPKFPEIKLHAIPALTELMKVCTENAIASREGTLDLRDADWVAAYKSRFEYGYHPIHGVVG